MNSGGGVYGAGTGFAAWCGTLMLLLLLLAGSAAAAGEASGAGERAAPPVVTIHYFRAEGCPHCANAGAFLERYAADPRIAVRDYEVRHDAAGREKFFKVVDALGVSDPAVPFIMIGDWWTIGYHGDEWSGAAIQAQVARCLSQPCADRVAAILAGKPAATLRPEKPAPSLPETIKLPLVGEVATSALSLPVLTAVLGAVDGFNPCAMWALVFLLGLLMGQKGRKRMWILGLAFLFGSGLVYYLIMAAWLNVLLAVGFATWIRVGVGIIALGGAAYYLYDFAANPDAACEVSHGGERQRILGRLRRFALEERLWPAVLGVLLLAIAVNLIELVCSAGIPAVYTQVLALTPMATWQYYGYLALYVLIYMLDDVAVFAVAVTALQMSGIGTRYARANRLIGGVILAAIGLMLLFRPEWLVFG